MRITVTGADRAKRMLEEAQRRSRDLRPVLEVAAQDLRTLVDDSFKDSKSPAGSPWAPLAFSTVEARRGVSEFRGRGPSGTRAPRQGPINAKPLIDTGRLRNSITTVVNATSVSVGSNTVYGGTHQFGRGRIPARPFLPQRSGVSGAFQALMIRIRRAVAKYISDGTIT